MNYFYFQDINPDSDLAILREGNFIKINGTEYEVSDVIHFEEFGWKRRQKKKKKIIIHKAGLENERHESGHFIS